MPTLRDLRLIASIWDAKQTQPQPTPVNAPGSNSHLGRTLKSNRTRKHAQRRPLGPDFESPPDGYSGLHLRHQQSEAGPLVDLRRRLARKASTFSLRTRHRRGQREKNEAAQEEEKLKELVQQGSDKASSTTQQEPLSPVPQVLVTSPSAAADELPGLDNQLVGRQSSATIIRAWNPATSVIALDHTSKASSTSIGSETLGIQEAIRKEQAYFEAREVAGGLISVNKMSTEQVHPPVPYTRLKEITEQVGSCSNHFSASIMSEKELTEILDRRVMRLLPMRHHTPIQTRRNGIPPSSTAL
jgi:hypothetical protein